MKATKDKLVIKELKQDDYQDVLSTASNELSIGEVIYSGSEHIGVGAKVYYMQRAAKRFTNNGDILSALHQNDVFAYEDGEEQ